MLESKKFSASSPGRVALIVGGARMGVSVGARLLNSGYVPVITYRSSKDAAVRTQKDIGTPGGDLHVMHCDIAEPASIEGLTAELRSRYGHLDVLVNLASEYKPTPANGSLESWKTHLDANSRGAYLLSMAVAPLMLRGGRMIHISDWTSASGRPRYAEYSAYYVSKAAIKAVVESLAILLAPTILVNAIAPGPMIPPPGLTQEERTAVERATPLGRWGGADEIAKAVMFLIETEFVTGETLRVDGGRHLL